MRLPLLAALLLLAAPAAAQRLEPGARVRIHPSCSADERCEMVVGELQALDNEHATIRDREGWVLTVLLAPTTRIDLSHGFRRRYPEGLVLGALAGAVLGTLFIGPCDDFVLAGARAGGCRDSLPIYLVAGGAVGVLVGWQSKEEQWVRVQERTIMFAPMRSGVGVGLKLGL
jgi:hypothetical protein